MSLNKKHKIIFLILLVIVCRNFSQAQGTWERLDSPTDQNLNSVYFVDSLYGWAAGDSGIIIHTSNGGTDWVIQDSKSLNNIRDIYFLNQELGWAVYWEVMNYPFGTYVLKTTNGGEDWISSEFPEENIFSQCILYLDSLNGWMGGKPYPIKRTTNGGISWTDAVIDSSNFSTFPVFDIQFFNNDYGYASGGVIDCCGIMWWTTNGGDNWQVIDTPFVALEPIYQLYVKDSLNVLGVGGDFESWGYGVGMMRTSDGGNIWDWQYIGVSGVGWDLDFRTDKEAWAPLGGEQKLIYSLDSGLTWLQIPSPDTTSIFKLTFPDSLHGIGVGNDGAIIRYKSDSSSEVINLTESTLIDFELYQNYPNPFNPSTTISYTIPEDGFVKLSVYNLLGQEVATIINNFQKADRYEVVFDANELSSGVYLYKIEAGSYSASRKFILMK